MAPKTLWLKKATPVMLLRNLSNKLVNGLIGTIHELEFGEIVVDFPTVQDHVVIQKLNFDGEF